MNEELQKEILKELKLANNLTMVQLLLKFRTQDTRENGIKDFYKIFNLDDGRLDFVTSFGTQADQF